MLFGDIQKFNSDMGYRFRDNRRKHAESFQEFKLGSPADLWCDGIEFSFVADQASDEIWDKVLQTVKETPKPFATLPMSDRESAEEQRHNEYAKRLVLPYKIVGGFFTEKMFKRSME